jgi:hypothetical protein
MRRNKGYWWTLLKWMANPSMYVMFRGGVFELASLDGEPIKRTRTYTYVRSLQLRSFVPQDHRIVLLAKVDSFIHSQRTSDDPSVKRDGSVQLSLRFIRGRGIIRANQDEENLEPLE